MRQWHPAEAFRAGATAKKRQSDMIILTLALALTSLPIWLRVRLGRRGNGVPRPGPQESRRRWARTRTI